MVRVAAAPGEQSTEVSVPFKNRIGPLSAGVLCGAAADAGSGVLLLTSDWVVTARGTVPCGIARALSAVLTWARRARFCRAMSAIPGSLLFSSRSRMGLA